MIVPRDNFLSEWDFILAFVVGLFCINYGFNHSVSYGTWQLAACKHAPTLKQTERALLQMFNYSDVQMGTLSDMYLVGCALVRYVLVRCELVKACPS